jgi:hypothetical protein
MYVLYSILENPDLKPLSEKWPTVIKESRLPGLFFVYLYVKYKYDQITSHNLRAINQP